MTTDFNELFLDIMHYAKKKIGRTTAQTKEDLEEYIKQSDPEQKVKQWVRRELVDTNQAQRTLEENIPLAEKRARKERLIEKAIKKELSRSQRARAADESRDAKIIAPITTANFKKWKKNPGRFDLRGIDNKTHALIRAEIKTRLAKARKAGYKVGQKRNDVYRLEPRNRRRSLITGRFVGKK